MRVAPPTSRKSIPKRPCADKQQELFSLSPAEDNVKKPSFDNNSLGLRPMFCADHRRGECDQKVTERGICAPPFYVTTDSHPPAETRRAPWPQAVRCVIPDAV